VAARWAETLGYCHQSTREALDIIRRLRRATYGLLVTFQEGAKTSGPAELRGGELSLDDWLEYHHRHIMHHIGHMKLNHDIWQRSHPPRNFASASS
jgi:hypothetical protein